jgi:predicted oxidoreductase
VDSPEQRQMGIKDSFELGWRDWLGTAGFERPEDHWPRIWARRCWDTHPAQMSTLLKRPRLAAMERPDSRN